MSQQYGSVRGRQGPLFARAGCSGRARGAAGRKASRHCFPHTLAIAHTLPPAAGLAAALRQRGAGCPRAAERGKGEEGAQLQLVWRGHSMTGKRVTRRGRKQHAGPHLPCFALLGTMYNTSRSKTQQPRPHRGGQPPHVCHRHHAAILAAAGRGHEERGTPRLQIHHRVVSQAAKGLPA